MIGHKMTVPNKHKKYYKVKSICERLEIRNYNQKSPKRGGGIDAEGND